MEKPWKVRCGEGVYTRFLELLILKDFKPSVLYQQIIKDYERIFRNVHHQRRHSTRGGPYAQWEVGRRNR